MFKKTCIAKAIAAGLLFAAAGTPAFAVEEVEPNHPITAAQGLEIRQDGTAEVNGVIGVEALSAAPVIEVDYYWFEGKEGDVITVNIDGGMKPAGSTVRSVDTILGVFWVGPGPTFELKRTNDDGLPIDAGSIARNDARIDNLLLEKTGKYVIGVSSFPREFVPGGGGAVTSPRFMGSNPNGSYKLLISGVTPTDLLVHINIEVKPGSDELAPVNPKAKGNVPVALLSSAQFDALKVKRDSITFGSTGDERSLLRCGKEGTDVNGDSRMDLICQFDNQIADFEAGDVEGIVRGYTGDGRRFEGRGLLKVVPSGKKKER